MMTMKCGDRFVHVQIRLILIVDALIIVFSKTHARCLLCCFMFSSFLFRLQLEQECDMNDEMRVETVESVVTAIEKNSKSNEVRINIYLLFTWAKSWMDGCSRCNCASVRIPQ